MFRALRDVPHHSYTQQTSDILCVYVCFPSLEIDECASDTDNCNINADCINTGGSFQCVCRTGFQGNGQVCTGVSETRVCQCVQFVCVREETECFSIVCQVWVVYPMVPLGHNYCLILFFDLQISMNV